jgi:hypothetical protein
MEKAMFHFALSLVRMSCGLKIQKDSSVCTTYCWLTLRREPSQRGRCREDRLRAEVLTRLLDVFLPT